MTASELELLLVTYAGLLAPWALLSAALHFVPKKWDFTPRWHGIGVPLFRTLFLVSLPYEAIFTERIFTPALYGLGLAGTAVWLLLRAWTVWRSARPLSAEMSIRYNLYYTANLFAFAVTMHSFVCMAILIHVSIAALLMRYRCLTRSG